LGEFTILGEERLYAGPLESLHAAFSKKSIQDGQQLESHIHDLEKTFGPLAAGDKHSLLSQMGGLSVNSNSQSDSRTHSMDQSGIRLPTTATQSCDQTGSSQSEFRMSSANQQRPAPHGRLIEELSSEDLPSPQHSIEVVSDGQTDGQTVVLRMQLPGVSSMGQCELCVSQVRIIWFLNQPMGVIWFLNQPMAVIWFLNQPMGVIWFLKKSINAR
jgi:hypothetical protein